MFAANPITWFVLFLLGRHERPGCFQGMLRLVLLVLIFGVLAGALWALVTKLLGS